VLAAVLHLQMTSIASDSQVVVNDIHVGTGSPHAAIVYEIMERKTSFHTCIFVFECRNFNFEAHNLIKFACNLAIGRHVWLGVAHDPNLVPMNIVLNQ
jgi:hypothetical protein